jgi:hypothetical protein
MDNTITTVSGNCFDFLHPERSTITIEDIAHALSNICRFTGHTSKHYSVAQHSVLVSSIVRPEYQLAALLHDAAEAFIGDVSSPLKRMLPDYKLIEERVEKALFERFGVFEHMKRAKHLIKEADLILLATEKRDLMPRTASTDDWEMLRGVKPLPDIIRPWSHVTARARFLQRYRDLFAARYLALSEAPQAG